MPSPSIETRKTSRLPTPAQQPQLASAGRDRWLASTAGILLVACILLLRNTYSGIWHDSVLYLGQALSILLPESFRHDLFFENGSQTSYSAFPWLLAWQLARFSTGSVFLWLTLTGLALFCATSWRLLSKLLPSPFGYYGILALLLLPSSYGAWETLSYLEPFLTGRTFAEPLALAALAALVARRPWLALAFWSLSALTHPLQALPALVVAWLWSVFEDRRWLHLLWLAVGAIVACVSLPQFDFLFDHIDPAWYRQIWLRSPIVFYSNSSASDWYYLLTDFFIVAIAWHHAGAALRRYLGAVLCGSALLLVSGLLLADVAHLAWPAAIQAWRAHWLLHWSAMGILPWLCFRIWHGEPKQRTFIFLSIIALGGLPARAHPLVPGIMLLYFFWPWVCKHLGKRSRQVITFAICLGAALHAGNQLWMLIPAWQTALSLLWLQLFAKALLPVTLVIAVAVGIWTWRCHDHIGKGLALLLLIPGFAWAAVNWDQRSVSQHDFTDNQRSPPPFSSTIGAEQQVLWLDNLLPTWSVLTRPQYSSSQQMAGIVFNRKTAAEAFRRKELMHVTDGRGRDCRITVLPHEPYAQCRPDDAAVRLACKRANGELSFFVLPYALSTAPTGIWQPSNQSKSRYYLYSCSDMIGMPVDVHS